MDGQRTFSVNEDWVGEEYEIDFSDFSKKDLEALHSYLNLIIVFNRGEEE